MSDGFILSFIGITSTV